MAEGREKAVERLVNKRSRWIRLELALVLAEGTCRRIGSIRRLRWSDVGFDPPGILWRAEFDKRHREQLVPIPEPLAAEIRAVRARLGTVGAGWVFRQATKHAPWAPAQCHDYLRQAEAAARVEKLEGGLWHAYRRNGQRSGRSCRSRTWPQPVVGRT